MFACCSVTCVDEILVGEAGVVHVMDCAGEYGGQSLKGREHRLNTGRGVLLLGDNNEGGVTHLEGRGAEQRVH